jgi:hypothetical protein
MKNKKICRHKKEVINIVYSFFCESIMATDPSFPNHAAYWLHIFNESSSLDQFEILRDSMTSTLFASICSFFGVTTLAHSPSIGAVILSVGVIGAFGIARYQAKRNSRKNYGMVLRMNFEQGVQFAKSIYENHGNTYLTGRYLQKYLSEKATVYNV